MKTSALALIGAVIGAPLIGGIAVSALNAQGADPDRAATEAIVREYLLENPEIIIEALERWRESQALLAATQAEDAVAANLPILLSGETGHALGADADAADVLVVEFFDYHCGYCRRATDFVLALAEEDDVRVVFQDLPILRSESRAAALAGLAAGRTGEYAAMHQQLMRIGGVIDDKAIEKAAKRARADGVTRLLADEAARSELEAKLEASVDIARDMGLEGTPTFVVASPDGSLIRVIPSYAPEQVEEAIAEVRAL